MIFRDIGILINIRGNNVIQKIKIAILRYEINKLSAKNCDLENIAIISRYEINKLFAKKSFNFST